LPFIPFIPGQFFSSVRAIYRARKAEHRHKRLRRGVFHSVKHLEGAIQEYIDHHNRNPKPFIWKAEAKDILAKVLRARSVLAATDKSRDLH